MTTRIDAANAPLNQCSVVSVRLDHPHEHRGDPQHDEFAGLTHPPHLSNPLGLDHAPHPCPGTLGLDAKVDFLGAVAQGLRSELELLRAGMARQHADVRQLEPP